MGMSRKPGLPPASSFRGPSVGPGIWGQMAPLTEFELHALCDPAAAALTVCPARTRTRALRTVDTRHWGKDSVAKGAKLCLSRVSAGRKVRRVSHSA